MEVESTPLVSQDEHDDWAVSRVAREFGVSVRTLRRFRDTGLLTSSRDGRYSAADRLRLELILKGKGLGFTLAEIRDLIEKRSGIAAADPAGPHFDQVHRMATDTFGTEEKAQRWLSRPTTALGGRTPLAVSCQDAEGVKKVRDLLKRIDHGLAV